MLVSGENKKYILTAGEFEVALCLSQGNSPNRKYLLTAGEFEVALMLVQGELSKLHGFTHNRDVAPVKFVKIYVDVYYQIFNLIKNLFINSKNLFTFMNMR